MSPPNGVNTPRGEEGRIHLADYVRQQVTWWTFGVVAECVTKKECVPGRGLAEVGGKDIFREKTAIESPAEAEI